MLRGLGKEFELSCPCAANACTDMKLVLEVPSGMYTETLGRICQVTQEKVLKTQRRAREMAQQVKALATKSEPLSASLVKVHTCILKGTAPLSLPFTPGSLSPHCSASGGLRQAPALTISSPVACTGWGVGYSSRPSTQHSSSITHLTWKSPVSHLQP